jgi:hypothetical protein
MAMLECAESSLEKDGVEICHLSRVLQQMIMSCISAVERDVVNPYHMDKIHVSN